MDEKLLVSFLLISVFTIFGNKCKDKDKHKYKHTTKSAVPLVECNIQQFLIKENMRNLP